MFNINANPLRVSSIVFFLAILILFISKMFVSSNYKIPASEVFEEENNIEAVSLSEFHETINNKESDVKIIDIRSDIEFQNSHIEGSINIPLSTLLDKNSKKLLSRNSSYILSESESKSYSTAFLLKQLGYDARPVNSNFETLKTKVIDKFEPSYRYYSEEKQQYDYSLFIKQIGSKPIIQEETKQTPTSQGGC